MKIHFEDIKTVTFPEKNVEQILKESSEKFEKAGFNREVSTLQNALHTYSFFNSVPEFQMKSVEEILTLERFLDVIENKIETGIYGVKDNLANFGYASDVYTNIINKITGTKSSWTHSVTEGQLTTLRDLIQNPVVLEDAKSKIVPKVLRADKQLYEKAFQNIPIICQKL
jgi:hypothetical protein